MAAVSRAEAGLPLAPAPTAHLAAVARESALSSPGCPTWRLRGRMSLDSSSTRTTHCSSASGTSRGTGPCTATTQSTRTTPCCCSLRSYPAWLTTTRILNQPQVPAGQRRITERSQDHGKDDKKKAAGGWGNY